MGYMRTRKQRNLFGVDTEIHFDENGKKIGETRRRRGWGAGERHEHFNATGQKIGETRHEWGLLSRRAAHYDAQGNRIGHSREDRTLLGAPIQRHYDESGNQVGQSQSQYGWFGPQTVHKGTFFPTAVSRTPDDGGGATTAGKKRLLAAALAAALLAGALWFGMGRLGGAWPKASAAGGVGVLVGSNDVIIVAPRLPHPIAEALREHGFAIPTRLDKRCLVGRPIGTHPFFVEGNFDGDAYPDVAIVIEEKDGERILVAILGKGRIQPVARATAVLLKRPGGQRQPAAGSAKAGIDILEVAESCDSAPVRFGFNSQRNALEAL